jgi:hypothetical protein
LDSLFSRLSTGNRYSWPVQVNTPFFNAWRRWEKLMDYGPYDYTLDRIGQLESRVMELERAGNATNRLRSAPDGMKQIGISRDATDIGYGDGKISV